MSREEKEDGSHSTFIDLPPTRACDDGPKPRGRPCRPVPLDFVERWPQFGWGKETGAEAEWHANSRTIERWLVECGKERMIAARVRWLAEKRAKNRAARYVMGRSLTPRSPVR
jgi:hypothetical protein